MLNSLKRLIADEDGATLVEYGLLIALIAAICVVIIGTLGTTIQQAFQYTSDRITNAGG